MIPETVRTENLVSPAGTLAETYLLSFAYPWEALAGIKDYIISLGESLPATEYEKAGDGIWVAKTAVVAPSASVAGPCIIGPFSEVRHCAYIRGSVLICAHAVVGNSCECKNSIILDKSQVPHFNYVGDSILGIGAHMGAGAVTSNFRSDKKNISIHIGQETVVPGLRKMGAVIGDHAEVGCGSVLNPGTILGRDCRVYPLSSVRGFVPAGHIHKTDGTLTPILPDR
ncbi:MAG: UDP-N-acetylglucosamine pyrophosphorylase [Clostridia bacterium]|nr:UDP-N-acetylglucosamine pyrophosphorylase [Clostridia bacterium]